MIKRKLAIFTIVQDEPEFLPRWMSYYTDQLEEVNIFVLYHVLPGRTTRELWDEIYDQVDGVRVNFVPVHNDLSFDHAWLARTVSKFQHFLLQSYEWALFAEVDELVVDRIDNNLAKYVDRLARLGRFAVRCKGYEVVQRVDELSLDRNEPWLAQRSWWYHSCLYSKVLLSRQELDWYPGFHEPMNGPCPPPGNDEEPPPGEAKEPHLFLIHLKKLDMAMAMERSCRTAARNWSPADLAAGAGRQNLIVDEAAMRAYFDANIDSGKPACLEPIPAWVKKLC